METTARRIWRSRVINECAALLRVLNAQVTCVVVPTEHHAALQLPVLDIDYYWPNYCARQVAALVAAAALEHGLYASPLPLGARIISYHGASIVPLETGERHTRIRVVSNLAALLTLVRRGRGNKEALWT